MNAETLQLGEPVAKKKPEKTPEPPESGDGAFLVRPADARLPAAIEAAAKDMRRSKNMAANILLEEALKERGFWPPTPPPSGKEPS